MFFFFQAEDGIRDRSPSRGLGDVYKRQVYNYLSGEGGWHVTECGIKNGQPYTLRYPDNVAVYVAANDGMIKIEQTSIYAQISFGLDKLGEYCMTRLVAVTD